MARMVRGLLLAAAACAPAVAVPALGQSAPADNMVAARYDAMGRVTGTIAPDPDGAGPIRFAAVRNSYDAQGLLIKVETGELAGWQSEAVAPGSWTGFTIFRTTDTTHDLMGRKLKDVVSAGGTAQSVVQYSYTAAGEPECTAVRMNPAVFGSLPASACTLGTEGTQGKDRITRNVYAPSGRLQKVQRAYGTPLQQDYVAYSYTPNGRQKTVTDANGTTATFDYDGHDRLKRWYFPSKTTAGVSSATDYEEYGYDARGQRTSLRKRDGSVLTYAYDALGRMTVKTVPARSGLAATHTRSVHYDYDLRGLQLAARFDSGSGEGVTFAYDNHGRLVTGTQALDGAVRTLSHQWNDDGLRMRVTRGDGNYTAYGYDGLDRLTSIHNNAALLVSQGYNAKGEVTGRTLPGATTALTYDALSRPASLSHDLAGTGGDLTFSYGYNAASQMVVRSRDNDAYIYGGEVDIARSYAVNGLNQYVSTSSGSAFCYDANGNLTADGSSVFLYDVENRLVEARAQANGDCAALAYTGTLRASLRYDPLGRLYETTGASGLVRHEYDGDELVAEYDGAGTILRRYTHGVSADDPVAWFEGSAMTSGAQHLLLADHQGSIVAVADASGTPVGIDRYDEWGVPDATNIGRFQYTGQVWLPDLGMYHYKARIYSPTLGRFLQTDPIGYKDQQNLYAYVGNDPVNRSDPTGLYSCGQNLTGAQCKNFKISQNAAIGAIQKGMNILQSARNKLASGEKLNAGENKAVQQIGRFFGSRSMSVRGIDRALGNAGKVLGELQGSKPAFTGDNGHMAVAVGGGRGIQLDRRNFFNASIGHQAFTLAHEASHTSKIAPIDFGSSDGTVSIGPYGYANALTRAARWPSSAFQHADTVPYAFGLRRPGDPDE